jgi:hypothetical protein
LSGPAARGHPRGDEPRAADIREADRHPESAPVDVLQRATLAHARATWRDEPNVSRPYNDERFGQSVRSITDRETLHMLRTISKDEWRERAREAQANGIVNSPFYYH